MAKYRKRPVIVEAVQWFPGREAQLCDLAGIPPAQGIDQDFGPFRLLYGRAVAIRTLEGEMMAHPGDWIIKGIKGEFYSIKADIFEASFEPAD